MFNIQAVKTPPPISSILKQIRFGTATGLTETAKQGQAAVIGALQGTFTIRGPWLLPSNRYGIRIKPATPSDPTAEIRTNADWLAIHEEGGDKHARGGRLAIPTDQVRRNKRLIIPRGQRPKGLGAKAFVLQTKHGPVLAQRISRGKRRGLIVLYGLEQNVHIKRQSTFFEPLKKVVARRLQTNINAGIDRALATAK
jgi:hypothetical protein